MALNYLQEWAPFSIDALGLVTMIGAEEVDRAIGGLVLNPWAEFLPLLGAFVIAGNRFVQPVPGVVLYNISDGVMATDVAGWLPRWLGRQNLAWNTSAYIWSCSRSTVRQTQTWIRALAIGFLLNSGLLVLSVLVEDWWGLANTIALIVSVIIRWHMLEENRSFLDCASDDLQGPQAEFVKIFCLLADGKAVTVFAPRGIVLGGFLSTPRPAHPFRYRAARALGWLSFGVHVIAIGQATLLLQILTVSIMIVATVITALAFGCRELQIGRKTHIHLIDDQAPDDRRTIAYARLDMSEKEEDSMLAWGLFPHRSNLGWWEQYRRLKESTNIPRDIKGQVENHT